MEFESAVQALCDGGVEFVVIGGLAAALSTAVDRDDFSLRL
jgi:hypothetical protein